MKASPKGTVAATYEDMLAFDIFTNYTSLSGMWSSSREKIGLAPRTGAPLQVYIIIIIAPEEMTDPLGQRSITKYRRGKLGGHCQVEVPTAVNENGCLPNRDECGKSFILVSKKAIIPIFLPICYYRETILGARYRAQ